MTRFLTFLFSIYLFLMSGWDYFFLNEVGFLFSPSIIIMLVIALVLFMRFLDNKANIKPPMYLVFLIIIVFYSLLSLFWALNFQDGFGQVLRLFSYLLMAFLIVLTYGLKYNLNTQVIISTYIVGLLTIGIYSLIISEAGFQRFITLGSGNPTEYSARLIWGIISLFYIYKNTKLYLKPFVILLFIAFAIFLLLTQGRNAILALLGSLLLAISICYTPIYYSFIKKQIIVNIIRIKHLLKVFALLIIFGFVIHNVLFYFNLYEQLDRVLVLLEVMDEAPERITAGRSSIWQNYLSITDFNLLIGNGVRSGRILYSQVYGVWASPHNVFILIFFNYGILGITLFTGFILSLLYFPIKTIHFRFTLFTFAFTLILLGFGNDTLYYKYWWIGIFLFLIFSLESSKNISKHH